MAIESFIAHFFAQHRTKALRMEICVMGQWIMDFSQKAKLRPFMPYQYFGQLSLSKHTKIIEKGRLYAKSPRNYNPSSTTKGLNPAMTKIDEK